MWPWVFLFVAIGLVGVFYLGGGYYFSNIIYETALKSEPSDPADLQRGTIMQISGKGDDRIIRILPEVDAQDETKFDDAIVGLVVGESLVVAGPAERRADGSQERPVLDIVGDRPEKGDAYGLTRDVWLSPDQLGWKTKDIEIRTLDGREFPAWLVEGDDPRKWAVLTHGINAARSEMLRMARSLRRDDYNLLFITYLGDPGAPEYPDGMVTYGREEWSQVEAAVRYATDEGGRTIVLGGASHGGAVTLGFLERSSLAGRISGVILDAPASSLRDVIDAAAEFRTLPIGDLPIPESLEDAAMAVVAFRFDVNFGAIDYIDNEGLIEVPLLTFQGTDDQTVPLAVNDRFMRQGSGRDGEYVVITGADHVLSWNVDRDEYEDAIAEFLKEVD